MKIVFKLILSLALGSVCSPVLAQKTKAAKEAQKELEKINEELRKDKELQILKANLTRYRFYGPFDSAITIYTRLINLKPLDAELHFGKGEAYFNKGELDSAMQEYNECLRVDPNYSSGYQGRGKVYNAMGNYAASVKEFELSFAKAAGYKGGYLLIFAPLARTLNFTETKRYYDEYKETQWGKKILGTEDYGFLKYYLIAVGESLPSNAFKETLANLNKASEEYNNKVPEKDKRRLFHKTIYTDILSAKGYALVMLNRIDEAKDTYEQALVINPNQPDVKEALANLGKKKNEIVKTDKTPPTIELISPQPTRSFDIESDNGATQITGRAKDESGIASIKINGKDIDKVEEDGLFITNLTLKPGANSIIIIATDKQGNASTKTFTLTGAAVAKKKELDIPVLGDATPKYYAILIAEKEYLDASIPDLQNPIKDARELKSILESQYSFAQDNIDTLYNRSREDIMQVIVQRCNTLTENDNLVIFYAGHGTAEKDKFGDIDGYWIPSTAKKGVTSSYISAEDINKSLKRSNAKHILVIADACFSGAFTRGVLPGDANPGIQKQYKVSSRKVMASGNLEPVPDNSKFLFYLKKNLQVNNEKYLSAKKLFDSFYDAIINNSENLPQYAAIKNVGDEGGEFVFIKK